MIRLAFCNDCDLLSWDGYRAVHSTLDNLGLPAGDSFWLFDPSGNDMGLFRRDCTEKGPRHDELLEEIRTGRIDVFHSAGQYSTRFGGGLRPDRKSIAEAIDYLAKHARIPRIWTNHGDERCVQNIGAGSPLGYHCGDDPASDVFILDLFLEAGVKYFWTDQKLLVDPAMPARLVAPERTRSGHDILVFNRFLGVMPWAPNGQNFNLQLNDANLDHWTANGQNVIVYQHWGCHHDDKRWAYAPQGNPLTEESTAALAWLRDRQAEGKVEVVRLFDLLEGEAAKAPVDEIDRIARVHSRSQATATDIHYYTQFHVHTIPYFNSRMSHLDPRGEKALDAGCGVGQWSLCLSERFSEIEAFDSNAEAIAMAQSIAASARLKINFSVRDIYATGYASDHFDFAICYGVIFLVDALRAMRELYRVLAPGGSCLLSVNGDGWYQYLIEERFKDRADEERQIYVECLYNAYVARCGGLSRLQAIGPRKADIAKALERNDRGALLQLLVGTALESNQPIVGAVLERFSDYTLRSVARRLLDSPGKIPDPRPETASWKEPKEKLRELRRYVRKLMEKSALSEAERDLSNIPLLNRPYEAEEFERIARAVGFTGFRWGRDASLSFDQDRPESPVKPLHELYYKDNLRVWECLVTKPKNAAPAN